MKRCAELLTEKLTEKDYKFTTRETDSGNSVVLFPNNGKEAQCFFSGDNGEYLSIYMIFESVPKDKYAHAIVACNDVNAQYKWVTAYIDKDNDIMLHLDALLSPDTAAEEAFEMLVRFFQITNDIKPVLMKAIYA